MFSANSSQVSGDKLFVEDVFSTYLYTGNGSTQTITNGIDLAGKGGLIWLKNRSSTAGNVIASHALYDTVRGIGAIDYVLRTDKTDAQNGIAAIDSVNSNGFTFGGGNQASGGNNSGDTYASWTFREAPKFFDVVTYTGNGVSTGRNISHNLGVRPGFIIVKRTDSTSNWAVLATDPITGFYHGGVTSTPFALNLTNAKTWSGGGSAASATTFNACHVQLDDTTNLSADFNVNGATYVAYLFANNAGGFGNAGTDSVISCGSFTTDGSGNATVNLGYEPQWLLLKSSTAAESWQIIDNMRGWSQTAFNPLFPNLSNAESSQSGNFAFPTATGFAFNAKTASTTYIYMAIRRGPMRTPTLGTSVFAPLAYTGNSIQGTVRSTGFATDLVISGVRSEAANKATYDRLRGRARRLQTSTTSGEAAESTADIIGLFGFDTNNGYIAGQDQSSALINYTGYTYANWAFRRAPGFFDEVCYTGTGNPLTLNHNLGVAPELILYKSRSNAEYWFAQSSALPSVTDGYLLPNYDSAAGSISGLWRTPNTTTFGIALSGNLTGANTAGVTYVSYLFASCPGVSKVGSYTGNGSSQTINCGFAAGARFVMIKRTDSTGDWYVWDTARGIVAGNDPHLSLNTTAAEVTTDDTIDTDSSGFVVNQVAATNVNVNAATYIYLAIA